MIASVLGSKRFRVRGPAPGPSTARAPSTAALIHASRAYAVEVQEPGRDASQPSTETLQVGTSRPRLTEKAPGTWRQPAAAVLVFFVGVAAGGGALLWWQARPTPPAFRVDEHAVELVLFEAVPPRAGSGTSESPISPLQVDGALLLSGLVTSTVLRIGTPGQSLEVRAPALPVTVSPTRRLQSVSLEIIVRDCRAASRWTPGVARPFTLAWRDEDGRVHLDRAGDLDRSLAISLARYVDSSCDKPRNG